ncbi:MAG TPA: type VI secretion system baseplate subunit TssK, partial [Edaphobacter sp.]|nr:type VI secretion system baseplate subunit TssK [Edaphobacter sp.]
EELTFRQEDLSQYHAASRPFNWGVSRLAVDETQLLQGRFTLLDLEALMPDGLPIWVDTRGLSQPALDLESLETTFRQQPFFVYLAAVAQKGSAKGERDLRYMAISEGEEAQAGKTEEEENGAGVIPRLRPRFHLIASHTPLSEKYVGMPIARVGFRNNVWALMDDYVYPLQRVSEDSLIGRQCAGALRRIRELALTMQDQWRNSSAEERLQAQRDQPLMMRSLVVGLPLCEALLSSQAAHPFQLYLAFCMLAGHLSSIASESVPPVFPAYNHSDLVASFAEVLRYIDKVLSENDSHEYLGVPFQYKDGIFSLLFAPEWKGKHLVLALRAQKEHEDTLAAWCESALIGSRKLQEGMRDRRVLGANRSRTLSERGLFSGAGTVLFHLEEDSGYILAEEPLDIASGPASERTHIPVEVTLYIYQGK